MGDTCIRAAHLEDAEPLGRLAVRAVENEGFDAEAIAQFMPALEVNLALLAAGFVFVAEDDRGGLVGDIGLRPTGWPGLMLIDSLFVDPPFQRRGIGRSLFQFAVRKTRSLRHTAMLVYSAPSAEGFYSVMGASKIGEAPFAYSSDIVLPMLVFPVPKAS
jgi:predicted N-acetyltransferase YhbS